MSIPISIEISYDWEYLAYVEEDCKYHSYPKQISLASEKTIWIIPSNLIGHIFWKFIIELTIKHLEILRSYKLQYL